MSITLSALRHEIYMHKQHSGSFSSHQHGVNATPPVLVLLFSGRDNSTLCVPTDPVVYVSRANKSSKYKSKLQVAGAGNNEEDSFYNRSSMPRARKAGDASMRFAILFFTSDRSGDGD
jgi:hypothetical protein